MKVVWAAEALEWLAEIEAFIARDSLQRAKQFVARLIQRGKSLAHSPMRGRIVPEVREIFLKSYRIVYRLHQSRIEIVTLFEGHRLLRRSEIFSAQK